jgi:hypothetical protein
MLETRAKLWVSAQTLVDAPPIVAREPVLAIQGQQRIERAVAAVRIAPKPGLDDCARRHGIPFACIEK